MDAGTMEHLLGCNQEMSVHLRDNGFDVDYHEYAGGHNYTVWRDDLPEALVWLIGNRV
jgi:enterochelin esterase family protein